MAALALVGATACAPTIGPAGPNPSSAVAVADDRPAATSGEVRGIVTMTGIGYGVTAADGSAVADALVYLDNLPDVRTKTGPDGSFRLLGVPTGDHYVVAEKSTPGGQFKVRNAVTIAASQPIADLKSLSLRRTGSVTGLVTFEGKHDGMLGTDVFIAGSTLIGKSKDNGAYALIDVAEGTYDVTASRVGAAPKTVRVTVKAGESSSLDIDLAKADASLSLATMTGKVVDGSGNALVGAIVSLKGGQATSTLTDETGAFALANVPDGDYQIQVYSQGFHLGALTHKVAVVPGDDTTKRIDLGTIRLDGAPPPVAVPPATQAPAAAGSNLVPAADATPTPAPASTAGPAATPTQAPTSSASTAAPTQETVPGTLDQQVKVPSGVPHTTTLGPTVVGKDTYSVQLGQDFTPTRNGSLTAFSASLSAGDLPAGADTTVAIFAADDAGMPTGAALGTSVIPGAKIRKLGLGSQFSTAIFATPVPVSAGKKYVAVVSCDQVPITWLLSNAGANGNELRISFAEPGTDHWLWNVIPDNGGYNFGVYRTYLAN